MARKRLIGGTLTSLALLCATPVHAHFVLLEPASWLNEDKLGGPQKGSPCGPGNTRPFIGDDVQPVPVSGAVTQFHAGETITVQWQETVYHPGYFRISLAQGRAADATSTTIANPPLTDPDNCHYDTAAVQTGAHDNVLADGLFMAHDQNGTGRSLSQKVTLPNAPCDDCTLQVVQVMEGHPAASCFYFHCADIQILPAAGGGAGSGAASTKHAGGGCSVAHAGAGSGSAAAWCMFGITRAAWRRRRRVLAGAGTPQQAPAVP